VGSALGLYRWPLSNDRDELGRKLRIGPAVRLAPLNLYPSALSPDGRALLADKDSRSIFLVNLEDPKSTRILIPDTSGISGYVLSPDGRWLATGSFNGSGAKVWDAHSGKLVRHLATAPSAGVCFSPDGNWLVTAANSVYQFWRVGSWQSGLKIPNADLVAMTFSPDSKLLAVARSIWEIQLVDVASGREVATLTSPQPFWNSNLRFSRDGSLLALAGRSNQGIGLWNLRAIRRQLAELKLDWDQPAYPPAAMGESADRPGLLKPLRVQLDWGEFDDGSIQSLLIAFFPFHAEAYYQRGVIWAKHGDRAEALANLDMAATLRPGHAETFFERGLIHAREARFQEAVADFSQTLALKPAHTEARGERAWAFLGLEQADKAVADFSQALARRPDDWDLWFGLGKVHGQLQRWSEAAEAFSKAAAHRPEFWPAWCFQAEASINLADWKTAVNGFSKALQRGDGSRTSVSRFLAYTLPSLRSRYVGVANDINTVLLPEAQILGRRGLARARAGQWEEAETDFAKAAKLDPGLIDVPYSHALAFLANSDLAGYRRVCAKMLDHFGQTNDPRTAHRAAWIAVLAPDAVKDWQQAVNLARKALAADPKNNDCAATLGAALYRTGRFQEAIPHLERAAAGREPAAPAAHSAAYAVFFLAMAHQRLGHSALASQWLKRALKRGQEVVQSDSKASPPWDWRLVFELLQRETEAVVIARASCSQGGLHELCPSAYFGTPVWVWPRLSAYALRQHFFDLLTPWLGLPTGA